MPSRPGPALKCWPALVVWGAGAPSTALLLWRLSSSVSPTCQRLSATLSGYVDMVGGAA